jgi:sec-independent protein translocase protein TatB
LSGVGFQELVLLFIIGLLILGPEKLPRVASQIGRWVGRARRTANQMRYQLEREIALADIEKTSKDLKRKSETPKAGESEPDSTENSTPGPAAEAPVAPEAPDVPQASESLGSESIAKPSSSGDEAAADDKDRV